MGDFASLRRPGGQRPRNPSPLRARWVPASISAPDEARRRPRGRRAPTAPPASTARPSRPSSPTAISTSARPGRLLPNGHRQEDDQRQDHPADADQPLADGPGQRQHPRPDHPLDPVQPRHDPAHQPGEARRAPASGGAGTPAARAAASRARAAPSGGSAARRAPPRCRAAPPAACSAPRRARSAARRRGRRRRRPSRRTTPARPRPRRRARRGSPRSAGRGAGPRRAPVAVSGRAWGVLSSPANAPRSRPRAVAALPLPVLADVRFVDVAVLDPGDAPRSPRAAPRGRSCWCTFWNGGTGCSTSAIVSAQCHLHAPGPAAWALAMSWSAAARLIGTFCASTK